MEDKNNNALKTRGSLSLTKLLLAEIRKDYYLETCKLDEMRSQADTAFDEGNYSKARELCVSINYGLFTMGLVK